MQLTRTQQLEQVIQLIASIVRNIHLKRVMHTINPNPHLNFWKVIYGNFLDIAVLEWCKLFGSDDASNQPTHWKNIFSNHQDFCDRLMKHLNTDQPQWHSYWEEIKRYRDQMVAHHDIRRITIRNYPILDIALQATFFYYQEIIRELRATGVRRYPEELEQYCNDFAIQAEPIAQKALNSTEDFIEEVY